jgi:hypothetical protein
MATPKEAAVLWIKDLLFQHRKEFEFGTIDRVWLASQIQAHYPHYELTDAKLRKIAEAYKIEEERIVKRLDKYLQARGIKR